MRKHYIIHRTGDVYDVFTGTGSELETFLQQENSTDDQGSTTVHSSHEDEDNCREEFFRLIDTN